MNLFYMGNQLRLRFWVCESSLLWIALFTDFTHSDFDQDRSFFDLAVKLDLLNPFLFLLREFGLFRRILK